MGDQVESPESPLSGRSVAKRLLNNRGSVITRFGFMVTDQTHDRQVNPPLGRHMPKSLRRVAVACEKYLEAVYTTKNFAAIEKNPGESWRSLKFIISKRHAARKAALRDSIIGVRPEKSTKIIVIDIDNKPGKPSPYWHPLGKSQEITRLQQAANAFGFSSSILASSASGGLHIYITMPEAIPVWQANRMGQLLLQTAGMEPGAGIAEVFPSKLPYRSGGPSEWAQSHGYRLPGQEGSGLVVGDSIATDPTLIYEQLLSDVENAKPTKEFQELLAEALQLAKADKPRPAKKYARHISQNKEACNVRWTAPGQSHDNLAGITTYVYVNNPTIVDEQQLGALIERQALSTEGFDEFASDETKEDLSNWCVRWARCSIRNRKYIACNAKPKISGDKDHNERLYRASRQKLADLYSKCKEAVNWSKNQIAKAAGITFRTLQKHWDYWTSLPSSEPLHTPSINGGGSKGSEFHPSPCPSEGTGMPVKHEMMQLSDVHDVVNGWILKDLADLDLELDAFLSRRL